MWSRRRKGAVLEPLFLAAGIGPFTALDGYDTDQLGTFTGEVARFGTQREAARKKATLALALSEAAMGLGSEGSFSLGTFGLGSVNLEVLVLIERATGLEVVEQAVASGRHIGAELSSKAQLFDFATGASFPSHGLVVSVTRKDRPIAKGIRTWAALELAFSTAQRDSTDGRVFVQSDLRADQNASRMSTIEEAGRSLLRVWNSKCRAFSSPGFAVISETPGRLCSGCGLPTELTSSTTLKCQRCDAQAVRRNDGLRASPSYCQHCNP